MRTTLPAGRVPDDWHAEFHRGLAARFWRAAGATSADDDAALALRALRLGPGARVLDVACGDGRIALRLARAGIEVLGLDVAPEELELARAAAAAEGLPARFELADLRELPPLEPHDGALVWGNAFGYLPHRETEALLAHLRAALRPGGRLAIETGTVAEALLAGGLEERDAFEAGGVRATLRHAYRPAESRLETEYAFSGPDGERELRRSAHHVYTTAELVRLLAAAGLRTDELLDGASGAEFRLGGRGLVIVAAAV